MNRFDKSPASGRSYYNQNTYEKLPPTDPNCAHKCGQHMGCCRVCGPSQSADPWDHGCHITCAGDCGSQSTK